MVSSASPKPVRLTWHARQQMVLRGADETEVVRTVRESTWQAAKRGKSHATMRFPCGTPSPMTGRTYSFKVIDVIFAEEATEIVVITVKVYYHD